MPPSTLSAASDRSSEIRILDCTYGDSIVYQNFPSNDLGGINSLYQSSYFAHRDTEFIRAYTDTNNQNRRILYRFYTSAIAQCSWPELVDIDNRRATWLVKFQQPNCDSGLTVARTMVALDPRWSLVGLLSFGDLGIVLQGNVTASEARNLQQGVFPSGLLKFGNPTSRFRGRSWLIEDDVGDSQQEQPRAEVNHTRAIDDSSSATSRGVSRGLSSRSNSDGSDRVTEAQHHTSPANPLPPFYQGPSDQRYMVSRISTHLSTNGNGHGSVSDNIPSPSENGTANDIANNADTMDSQSNGSSEEDEEIDVLPSYRQASRRLARHQRLLAEDPTDIVDPAGTLHSTEAEVEDLDHFEVPPTYHDRGEEAPGYNDATGNDRARDEEGVSSRGPGSHQRDSVLPVIVGILLPAYADVTFENRSANRVPGGDSVASTRLSETAVALLDSTPPPSGPESASNIQVSEGNLETAPSEGHRAPAIPLSSIPNPVSIPQTQPSQETIEQNAAHNTAPLASPQPYHHPQDQQEPSPRPGSPDPNILPIPYPHIHHHPSSSSPPHQPSSHRPPQPQPPHTPPRLQQRPGPPQLPWLQ